MVTSVETEMLRKQLQDRETQVETEMLRKTLQDKETQLECMASQEMEAHQCMQPAKSYGVYLKDQWLQFQIKTLAQRGTTPFQDYGQFMDLCDHSLAEDKVKLEKFYLHNMSLTDMNLCDPNVGLGDLKLMGMASWMIHEEKSATEIKKLMEEELNEPLMILFEPVDPMALISSHQHLADNPQSVPKYINENA